MEPITSFKDSYFFLSNMFMAPVGYEGILYPSSEHAYVAAKTTDEEIREKISKIASPFQMKKFGRTIPLRDDWERIKVNEMRRILERKFSPFRSDLPLYSWLSTTAPRELIEGNTWNDRFWGQCPVGNGKNMLGKLLMEIRDDITLKFGV
jgi:ribA/ribD-fused uncharacterized protein